jgi:hypothetical protein
VVLLQGESVGLRSVRGEFLEDVISVDGGDGLDLVGEVFRHGNMFVMTLLQMGK